MFKGLIAKLVKGVKSAVGAAKSFASKIVGKTKGVGASLIKKWKKIPPGVRKGILVASGGAAAAVLGTKLVEYLRRTDNGNDVIDVAEAISDISPMSDQFILQAKANFHYLDILLDDSYTGDNSTHSAGADFVVKRVLEASHALASVLTTRDEQVTNIFLNSLETFAQMQALGMDIDLDPSNDVLVAYFKRGQDDKSLDDDAMSAYIKGLRLINSNIPLSDI